MIDDIPAVVESADFGPAYEGETFVLVTLRVPKDTLVRPGLYALKWTAPLHAADHWAKAKDEEAYGKRREARP